MLSYGIGLDVGITSVGWATVALDGNDKPYGIIGMGARIFDAAEQPKTGESLAAPRREARSMRRRLRRHRHRNERIRALLVRENVLSEEQLSKLFDGQLSDVYALRTDALDRPLTNEELARVLIHISQRRGFRSNRKGASTKEDGELLASVNANADRMRSSGYRTVAELFLKDPLFQEHKRNKGGNYIATVSRDMIEDEVQKIFAAQRSLGNLTASETLEDAYTTILLGQRSFDDGPACGPYSGNMIDRMIGTCTFEPNEQRAAKATYSFEYFSLLEAVNHIRLIHGGESTSLSAEQRQKVVSLAHRTPDLTYSKIRKELEIPQDWTFRGVSYRSQDNPDEAEKKAKLNCLKAYHQMRTAFENLSKGHFETITREQRNAIGETLSRYKTSKKFRPALHDAGLSEEEIDAVETLSFSKFGHISVKACDRIIPFLEQGMVYNEACAAAGYEFHGHDGNEKSIKLPPLDEEAKNEITSPVALRAISQTIKVVNAIIRERGCSPTYVKLELAREMAKDFHERLQIKKEQDENHARNELLMEQIRTEYKHAAPTGQDLVKYRLYMEQAGVCAYSLKQMSLEHLFDPDYAEVDHIIPYSISFDDSYRNKVLVFSGENRNKGARLPLQYLEGKRRDNFIVWVNSSVRDEKKRQNLQKERITADDEKRFIERNLQDTKTASRFLLNYIQDHLAFAPFVQGGKKHVTAVNGSVTAYLRKRWGISKVRANGDLHHAVDALVIACTTDGLIQSVSQYSKYRENRYTKTDGVFVINATTGEVLREFPFPWPLFRKELEARLSPNPERVVHDLNLPLYYGGEIIVKPLFVSRMPRRKVTGAAHLETVKATHPEDGLLVSKRPLTKLKLDKDGEIANYYMPQSDRLLYEALRNQLRAAGGNAKRAFAEPFHKPRHDGTAGPLVTKVKLYETSTMNVPVQGGSGVADNGNMVRIDVFHVKEDGYYFVPIYVADTVKSKLPNKACVQAKTINEWKEMQDEDFLFSLYPDDLIKVTHRHALKLTKLRQEGDLDPFYETKSEMLYYEKSGIATATLTCINHDNCYGIASLGIKTLEALEKYEVDVLGNYHKVRKERRQGFGSAEK